MAEKHLMAEPIKQVSYQPVGDLQIEFAHAEGVYHYRRALDLETATATVYYVADGVAFLRESFISPVDGVLVLRL
ncbi:glycoside hydrolase N-terminal domain-containing protein, partial [Rhizobium brockwellii]|uniref:glycoside hydrolase N-terminal domain-containing protein n=1 Tax=Rhizobium brockwellii TaxID=3019932 RepID=UPI003F9A9A69